MTAAPTLHGLVTEPRSEAVAREELAKKHDRMAEEYRICAKSGRFDSTVLFAKMREHEEAAKRLRENAR